MSKKHHSHRIFGGRSGTGRGFRAKFFKEIALIIIALGAIAAGGMILWMSTFTLPDLNSFDQRKVTISTKLYDRTGEILLYDIHQDIRRTVVPFADISRHLKNATVAIEDAEFYQHHGIKPSSIIRSVIANIKDRSFSQGGSTITQQVIKNSLLTTDKHISRKLKEWVLALKLERMMTKDEILSIYLNETPYGGNLYGIEEASQSFFGKKARDLSLAESAYLAALPQAPTYYSPFGNNKVQLENRKNLVLKKMVENGFITESEYKAAQAEKVKWGAPEERGIKAPHFVVWVKEYLTRKYGEKAVNENGYKVVTTLDWELQQKAQEITKKYAIENEKALDAENAGMVAVDPKTGQVLVMVGSRDYFDKDIDGNYNVTLAKRQPGSSFKPFAYAEAFVKGYLPETVLFDLKTEFSAACSPESVPLYPNAKCYTPGNYDDKFRGPMTLRDALAQSINIPAIKVLYLAGINDTLQLAKDMGVESLGSADRYGLTLVLGGGEVSPLEMTSAYGVFANNGVRNPYTAILRIEDRNGNIVEEFQPRPKRVLQEEAALMITDVLSDNVARTPGYGTNSPLYFPGRDVAAKTGTTNDYRDAWIIGYTPNIAVGTWAGNNDSRPIKKEQTARFIVAPMWNAFMQEALKKFPDEKFKEPAEIDLTTVKPAIRGVWQGGQTFIVDRATGQLANDQTPPEMREERVVQEIHSILHWVDKNNPSGPIPTNPRSDSQYDLWEYPIRLWAQANGYADQTSSVIPTQTSNAHTPENAPVVRIVQPTQNAIYSRENSLMIAVSLQSKYPVRKIDYYLNNSYLGTSDASPFSFSFIPKDNEAISSSNQLRAVATDSVGNKGEAKITFGIQN